MIKVNLAKRKTSVVAKESTGQAFTNALNSEALKEIPIAKIVATVFIYFGSTYGVNYYKKGVIDTLKAELFVVNERRSNLEKELVSFKKLEKIKERLEADEKLIRGKIIAIKEVVAGRNTGVRLLSHLSKAMDESEALKNLWLVDFGIRGESILIKGQSLDPNLVSEFIENIKKIPLLHKVSMDSLKQVKLSFDEVSEFSLTAMKREVQR